MKKIIDFLKSIPKEFNITTNLKHAIGNGLLFAGIAFTGFEIRNELMLAFSFLFGAFGGSASELLGFMRNKPAILAYLKTKSEEIIDNEVKELLEEKPKEESKEGDA